MVLRERLTNTVREGLHRRPRKRIGGRLVRVVLSLLLVPVDGRIVPRIARRRIQNVVIVLPALEALLAGPGLDQRAVDREVFIGKQFPGPRLPNDEREELFGDRAVEQAVAV